MWNSALKWNGWKHVMDLPMHYNELAETKCAKNMQVCIDMNVKQWNCIEWIFAKRRIKTHSVMVSSDKQVSNVWQSAQARSEQW